MFIITDFLGIRAIKRSVFFDKKWYVSQEGYSKRFLTSPAKHYYKYGVKEGLDPSDAFSNENYLNANPDVAMSGMNPLVHYERFGRSEDRLTEVKRRNDSTLTISACKERLAQINEYMDEVLEQKPDTKFILLFSHLLNLTGAPRALLNYAMGVKDAGYHPIFMALKPGPMSEELDSLDIPSFVLSGLQSKEIISKTIELMDRCNIVVFNTLATAKYGLSFTKTTAYRIAWIHEAEFEYGKVLGNVASFLPSFDYVYSVGYYSKSFTDRYVTPNVSKMFLYGIPDRYQHDNEDHDGVIFAIIGAVGERKAQSVVLDAIDLLDEKDCSRAEFIFIGGLADDSVGLRLLEYETRYDNVMYCGTIPNEEVLQILRRVDVVLTPSLDDPMPIVATEAMMCEKVALVSDHTGTAGFIEDGVNGFVVEAGNAQGLADKITYAINHKEKLTDIGKKAREIYESNFTMEVFKKNIVKMLEDAEIVKRYYEAGESKGRLLDVQFIDSEARLFFELDNGCETTLQVDKQYFLPESTLSSYDLECFNEYLAKSNRALVEYCVPIDLFPSRMGSLILREKESKLAVQLELGNMVNFYQLSKQNVYIYVFKGVEITLCNEERFLAHSREILCRNKNMLRTLEELVAGVEKKYHLYIESLDNHNDNAYQLFLEEFKKNTNAYFVTSQRVKDTETNVEIRNHMVVLNSDEYKYMVPRAQKIVVSWWMFDVYGSVNSAAMYPYLNLDFTAVMHGISYDKKSYYLHYLNFGKPNEIICCSALEKDYFEKCNGHKNISILGYPRMDKWSGTKSDDKMVFFFPTWREEISENYLIELYRICTYVSQKMPELQLVYVAHPSINQVMYRKICECIKKINPSIITHHSSERDAFNQYFASAKYLITDYSSVAYDFAYKKDSVVIYDLNPKMIGDHYELLDSFENGHCGVLTYDTKGIMKALAGDYDEKLLQRRKEKFFAYHDNMNTLRVLDKIHNE